MVAKPREEDDPRYKALMGEMRLRHKKELAAATNWVRDSDNNAILAMRQTIDNGFAAAKQRDDMVLEIMARFAQLGFEYAHLQMYDEDKSDGKPQNCLVCDYPLKPDDSPCDYCERVEENKQLKIAAHDILKHTNAGTEGSEEYYAATQRLFELVGNGPT